MKEKKIHCINPISIRGTERFTEGYQLTKQLEEADGVLVRSGVMHELSLPEQLVAVARAGAGVNNIPIDRCTEQGIVVFNTPGANANGVKELVLAGLLMAARDIIGGVNWCKSEDGNPDIAKAVESGKKAFAGTEIRGKKLGVIGLGAIGVEVANAASWLGMEVYGYDPFISVNGAWMLSRNVKHITSVDTIFTECDYITIHVPLLDSTRHMICEKTLNEMKQGVVILNFARDLLVDDDDMEKAIQSGKVKCYVTDFPNARTVHMDGVIAIPHLGASTEESEENCAVMAVDQMMDYLENGSIRNSVNFPDCQVSACRSAARITVLHYNIPNMIGQFAALLAAEGGNISDMTNKSKDKLAYTIMDVEDPVSRELEEKLKKIKGVLRVRILS